MGKTTTPIAESGKELIEEFETFWCRELRNLYRLEGKDHQANLTFDVESVHNRFDEIEQDQNHEFQALRAELQALKAQMDATIDATTAKHDVPSVVTAPTVSTNSNPNDSLMAMMTGLVAALQQNQNQAAPAPRAGNPTNPRNPRNRNRANEWRLVDKWCWNCSANTTHNSIDCRSRGTKAPAHKDATMDEPSTTNAGECGITRRRDTERASLGNEAIGERSSAPYANIYIKLLRLH